MKKVGWFYQPVINVSGKQVKSVSLLGKGAVNITKHLLHHIWIVTVGFGADNNPEVDVGLVVVNIRNNASGQNNVFNLKRSKSLLRLFNKEIGNVEQSLANIIIDEIMFVKNKRAQRCIVLHICRNLIYKLVFCYILFPAILGLMLMAKPIFHTLFGTKWDPSIILFQLLLLRGIFTVLMSLYNNYIISLGHGGTIVRLEIIRDATALIALAITFPYMTLATSANPVRGLEIMLWAQAGASALTYMVSLAYTVRFTRVPLRRFMLDMLPYFAQTMLIIPIMSLAASTVDDAWLQLTLESITGLALYIGGNYIFKSKIQRGVFDYIRGRDI